MNEARGNAASEETLRQEYAEVCQSHNAIADFRAKLLGLLPLAAGTGVFLVLKDKALADYLGAIGLFGSALTFGLFSYELRGLRECRQLRRCGQELEEALKLSPSQGRFSSTPIGITGPQSAGWMIYLAVVSAWLYVAAVGFSWPQPVRLLLPAIYIIIVALRLLHLARVAQKSTTKQVLMQMWKRALGVLRRRGLASSTEIVSAAGRGHVASARIGAPDADQQGESTWS